MIAISDSFRNGNNNVVILENLSNQCIFRSITIIIPNISYPNTSLLFFQDWIMVNSLFTHYASIKTNIQSENNQIWPLTRFSKDTIIAFASLCIIPSFFYLCIFLLRLWDVHIKALFWKLYQIISNNQW